MMEKYSLTESEKNPRYLGDGFDNYVIAWPKLKCIHST
jgi:hypothetical protein